MAFGDNFLSSVEELAAANEDEFYSKPVPVSELPQQGTSSTGSNNFRSHEPPIDEFERFWSIYQNNAIVKQLVNSFALEVIEPGWWVEADSDETAKNMAKWLRRCAIVNNDTGLDLTLLLYKAVIQAIVKGSVFIEHVPARGSNGEPDYGSFAALQFLPAETVTPLTRGSKAILLDPEDEVPNDPEITKTENDETPAYAQFYGPQFRREPVMFSKNDVTQYIYNGDVNDQHGTSDIVAIAERSDALKNKLVDIDQAIESKAWPTYLFKFGSEDRVWHPDDIDSFMQSEGPEQFSPGTKHGVQGDISVEEYGGDVPAVSEILEFDLNYIITGIPQSKAVTAFDSESPGPLEEIRHKHVQKAIRKFRRDLEYHLYPMMRQKAEVEGWDPAGMSLHIAPPEGEEPEAVMNERGTTIRYSSDTQDSQKREDRTGNQYTSSSKSNAPESGSGSSEEGN